MIFKTNIVKEMRGPSKCKFCQGTQLHCYNQKTGAVVLPTWECANCGALIQMDGMEERYLFDRVYILKTPTPIIVLALNGLNICDYRIVNLTSFAQNFYNRKYQTVMVRGQISKSLDFHKGIESLYIEKEDAEDGMAILPCNNENLKWVKEVMKFQAALTELYKEKPNWNVEQSKNIFDISGIEFPTVSEILNPTILKAMGVRGHNGVDPNMYAWQQIEEEKVNHVLNYLLRMNKTIDEVTVKELNENLPIVQTKDYSESDIEATKKALKDKSQYSNKPITVSEVSISPIEETPSSDPHTDLVVSVKENKGILPSEPITQDEITKDNTEEKPPVEEKKKRTRRSRAEMEAARALEAEKKKVANNAIVDPINTTIVNPPSEPKEAIQIPTTPEVPIPTSEIATGTPVVQYQNQNICDNPSQTDSTISPSDIITDTPIIPSTQTDAPTPFPNVVVTNTVIEEPKSRTDELLSHMTLKPMVGE